MSPGRLSPLSIILKCETLLKTFNPDIETLDSFLEKSLGDDSYGPNAHPDKAFIQQVVYGCVTQKSGMKIFLTNFYGDNSSVILRSDYTLYLIFGYLILFRMKELGFEGLKFFVDSQEPGKMYHILSYCFLGTALQKGVKQEWLNVYDLDYIDQEIYGLLQTFRKDIEKLCDELTMKSFGQTVKKEDRKSSTSPKGNLRGIAESVVQAPNLSKPKRRRVPMPLELNTHVNSGDHEDSLPSFKSVTLESIAAARKASLEKEIERTVSKYSKKDEFNLHQTKTNLQKLTKDIETKRQKESQFNASHLVPPPKLSKKGAIIKMTNSSILKEDALFKKKQQIEVDLLKAYEEDLRDCSEFYNWQKASREHDVQVQKRRVEERRILARASSEEAKLALEKNKVDNYEFAVRIKQEALLLARQKEIEDELRLHMNQQLVKEIAYVRDYAPKKAKESVFNGKVAITSEEKALRKKAWIEKLEEDKRYEEEKNEKIRLLKAEHEVIRNQIKVFDPTETSGAGFLNEISLVEVKERLHMNRQKEIQEQERKRLEILEGKAKKKAEYEQRVQNISILRTAARKDAQNIRLEKKEAHTKAAKKEADELERKQLALLGEIEEKRQLKAAELKRLKEEEAKIKAQQKALQEKMRSRKTIQRQASSKVNFLEKNENQDNDMETKQNKGAPDQHSISRDQADHEEGKSVEDADKISMNEIDEIINNFNQTDDNEAKTSEEMKDSESEANIFDVDESILASNEKKPHFDADFHRAKEDMKDSLELEDLLKKDKVEEIRERRVHLKEKMKNLNLYAYHASQKSIERARAAASTNCKSK